MEVGTWVIGLSLTAGLVLGWRFEGRSAPILTSALLLALLAGLMVYARLVSSAERSRSATDLLAATPVTSLPDEGFVSSAACRSCHPSEHASWRRSYHRTMTQRASAEAVLAPFDDQLVESRGRTYRLLRRGETFWADMVDPGWEHERLEAGVHPNSLPDPPRSLKRVVMTTGSHHHQTYWVAGRMGRELLNLPLVYLLDEERWVPREDVFMRPPELARSFDRWNDNCIECHSTACLPEKTPELLAGETHLAELGIACEACHGPAAAHVAAWRHPLHRYAERRQPGSDETIVNPADLSHEASSQICGQCHGLNLIRAAPLRAGRRHHAGQDLRDTRIVLRGTDRHLATDAERQDWEAQLRHLAAEPADYMLNRFWSDGMVRVSGRENNAMIESACFRRGGLSCLSCHSMHRGDPEDQLDPDLPGDEACLQCHREYEARPEEHTHHRRDSAGSRCTNCHMPHTVYGLLKAIRSHWIDSPTVAAELATGRPNACNLCHLDRPLEWTARHLREMYGQPEVLLNDDQRNLSAAVVMSLSGDANQRALIAWHMGWSSARQAAGDGWQAPYLAHLLNDPYAAVRFVAGRSLRRLDAYQGLAFDFVGSEPQRSAVQRAALQIYRDWLSSQAQPISWASPAILTAADGKFDVHTVRRLAAARDDRPVDLRE